MPGAKAFIDIDPSAVATTMPPLCAAVSPKSSCSISGSRKGCAPWVMRVSEPAMTDVPKEGSRISDRSMIGSGVRRAWRT